MTSQASYTTTAVAVTGLLGGVYCAYRIYKQINETKLPRPEEWRRVGTLQDVYIHPIKSCGSIAVDHAECTQLGLRDGWLRDRVLMITNKRDNFITARTYPEMLLIHPTVKNSILTLNHADMEPIQMDLATIIALGTPKTATVWGVEVPVYDCGRDASNWISKVIDNSEDNYSLVYYASENPRDLRTGNQILYEKFKKSDTGAFPDEVPYNLISQASIDDLNDRLEDSKVTPRNFRPNFVISGSKPYEEDNWKFVKIGMNVFEILKPCTRCLFTTIDPETGVRDSKAEPLETLRSYRLTEDPILRKATGLSPRMGLQISLRSAHNRVVSVGDPVYVF